MKVVLFGNNERGCVVLEALVEKHDVLAVVCLPYDVQPKWSRNMIDVASELNVPVCTTSELSIQVTLPDIIILAGWPKFIDRSLYENFLCLNLHAGPLPRYRGRAPINWQIIKGEDTIGFSIAQVDGGIDTGPIYVQGSFGISDDDTYSDILEILLDQYPKLLLHILDNLDSIAPTPQKRTDGFFCTARFPSDGLIDWSRPSKDVHNLIRALTYPMPSAFTYHGSKRIDILGSKLIKTTYKGVPGRIAAHWPFGVVVCCADRGLLVKEWNGLMPKTGETLC